MIRGNEVSTSVAALITDPIGRLVITKEGDLYGIPAGRIEGQETPLNAVYREVEEETEIRRDEMEIVGSAEELVITKSDGGRVGYLFRFNLFLTLPRAYLSHDPHGDVSSIHMKEIRWVTRAIRDSTQLRHPEYNIDNLVYWVMLMRKGMQDNRGFVDNPIENWMAADRLFNEQVLANNIFCKGNTWRYCHPLMDGQGIVRFKSQPRE